MTRGQFVMCVEGGSGLQDAFLLHAHIGHGKVGWLFNIGFGDEDLQHIMTTIAKSVSFRILG